MLLLLAVFAALLVWKLLPFCFLFSAARAFRPVFLAGPEAVVEKAASMDAGDLLSRLRELGFAPLGVKGEVLPLWAPTVEELSLTAASAQTFASVVRISGKLLYYFYTPFSRGLVLTANASFRAVNSEDVLVSVAALDPELLFRRHLDLLRQHTVADRVPLPTVTAADRLDATTHYYATAPVRRNLQTASLTALVVLVAGLCLLTSIAISHSRATPGVPSFSSELGSSPFSPACLERVPPSCSCTRWGIGNPPSFGIAS